MLSKHDQQMPLNICLLRLSAIGDVCHAVATVQAIQRYYPQAQMTWVIGKIEAQLLQGLPGVRLVIFNKALGLKAYADLKQQLQGQKFDILLHMQVALRANLAAFCIKATRKIGFDNARSKELHSLFINEQIAPEQQAHVLENFAGFAQHLGIPFLTSAEERPSWHMPLTAAEHEWAQEILAPYRSQGINRFLVIAAAASKAERNWLPERYAALADYAAQQGFQVILCGGPSPMEAALNQAILAATKTSTKPLNLVGQTNLKQLLALLQQASLVVAPDTGPAHMAVTVGTPVIGLYAHSNPARTGPYLYQDYVVETYHAELMRQTGKNAQQHPFGTRVKGENIMANIQLDSVKAMFDRVVKEQKL